VTRANGRYRLASMAIEGLVLVGLSDQAGLWLGRQAARLTTGPMRRAVMSGRRRFTSASRRFSREFLRGGQHSSFCADKFIEQLHRFIGDALAGAGLRVAVEAGPRLVAAERMAGAGGEVAAGC